MHRQWKEQQRNREAESAAVRRAAWGESENQSVDDDDMGHTILGDIYGGAPQQPQQPSQLASMLAGFAIAAASGLGGYYLASRGDAPEPAAEYTDETVDVGLGRIEDYIRESSGQ